MLVLERGDSVLIDGRIWGQVFWTGIDKFGKERVGVVLPNTERAFYSPTQVEPAEEPTEVAAERERAQVRKDRDSRIVTLYTGGWAKISFPFDRMVVEGIKTLVNPQNRSYNRKIWTVLWNTQIEQFLLDNHFKIRHFGD